MTKFKIKTHLRETEITAEHFYISYDSSSKQLIDYISFEIGDTCVEQIPVIDNEVSIFAFVNEEWVELKIQE